MDKEPTIEVRVPTKAQYSYINITGTPSQVLAMGKEQLMELLEKANNACKLAKTVDMTNEEKFEAFLGESPEMPSKTKWEEPPHIK